MGQRKPAGAVGKKKKQGKGVDGQLQEKVWDPGGSQQQSRGSHEQELMIFPAVEYDAGASSTRTHGETAQRLSTPLNQFRILTMVFPINIFLN
jgi:hypothetical protein